MKAETPEKKEPDIEPVPPQMVRAALVPEQIMQGLIDALRDHVPHKVADPLLTAVKTVQYGNFPVVNKPPE